MPMSTTLATPPPSSRERKANETLERKRLDEVGQKLVEDHVRLAERLARRSARFYPHFADEILGSAYAGLVDAAALFDPAKGYKFTTLATHRIRGQIADDIRSTRIKGYRRGTSTEGKPRIVSLDRSFTEVDDLDLISLHDALAADIEPADRATEYHDTLEALARGLPRQHGNAIRLYFGQAGWTMSRIGRELGLSKGRVSQMVKQAAEMIRERLSAPANRITT